MLEITVSDSEKMLLKSYGFKNVISFCILLSYGNIQNLKTQVNKRLGNLDISVNSQIEELNKIKNKNVRIWYSSTDNEDVSTLYFLISHFYKKDIEVYVCDVADENHFSLGSYSVDEIDSLLFKTRNISVAEKQKYYDRWLKLTEENADIRILQNNTIVSTTFDYLDNKIISILEKYKKMKYWSLVGECMSERLCGFYGDIFFIARINELIKANKIEICEVKKEYNAINELVEQKYLKIVK